MISLIGSVIVILGALAMIIAISIVFFTRQNISNSDDKEKLKYTFWLNLAGTFIFLITAIIAFVVGTGMAAGRGLAGAGKFAVAHPELIAQGAALF
jgi:hypothetical protein